MKDKVRVEKALHSANDTVAQENRRTLDAAGVLSLNLMASPGAGKTSLLERTIAALKEEFRIAVIDGDIATSIDADRAAAAGASAVQINTGGGCHLDAVMLRQGLGELDLPQFDLLLVENVGNLICPANFALGVHANVLVASIPEGDDKPYKYPGIYRGVDVLVINKMDLLPYVPFDMPHFRTGIEALNRGVRTFAVSCHTGEGLDDWYHWVRQQVRQTQREVAA